MRSLFVLAVFSLGLSLAQSDVANDNPVVLRIGDSLLKQSEFEERFTFYIANIAAQQNVPLNDETKPVFASLRPAYLEQLATEQVVLTVGKRFGLVVSEALVDVRLETLKSNFDNDEAYQDGLAEAGIQSEALLRILLAEAELSRLTVEQLRKEVEVPDYQVQLYYESNIAQFTQAIQTCAKHILLETTEQASNLRVELNAGASFEDLAKDHSLDTGSAERGGDLGCFGYGAMVPEFEEAAFNTPLDQISEPVKSPFGYHLILPYERKPERILALDAVKDDIIQTLEQDILRDVIEGYRQSSDVELFTQNLIQEGSE